MELRTSTHALIYLWNKFAFAIRHIECVISTNGNEQSECGNCRLGYVVDTKNEMKRKVKEQKDDLRRERKHKRHSESKNQRKF